MDDISRLVFVLLAVALGVWLVARAILFLRDVFLYLAGLTIEKDEDDAKTRTFL